MTSGKKIAVDIMRDEWEAFPKDKQERLNFLLSELFECTVEQFIKDDGDNDGRN